MSNFDFLPAEKPTFYYIGVTTTQSSIMKVFPKWAEYLGIGGTPIVGINCKILLTQVRKYKMRSFLEPRMTEYRKFRLH